MAFSAITDCGQKEIWHVNDTKPGLYGSVVALQADGHELVAIAVRFSNIPIVPGICKWRGEMAQFIYDNL